MTDSPHVLFLTGRLAEPALRRTLQGMTEPGFTWQIREMGVSVAALMTTSLIGRRLFGAPELAGADRVILPGRCRGDIDELAARLGVPVERGPEELKDLPRYFGRQARPIDLTAHDMLIFAEIVDAPMLDVDGILVRARQFRAAGTDVIDLGGLPATPFPHLADAVKALHDEGLKVSVDSMDREELLAGAAAGADYLLSFNEHTLADLGDSKATPILVPAEPGDLASLLRAIDAREAAGLPYLADPILDPVHTGFTESIVRYRDLRRQRPDASILMGVGNLTELTHVDTAGVNMLLLAIASELAISAILTTQVSPHACRAIAEADHARRILYAARQMGGLPRHVSDALMMLHERDPFPDSAAEIRELAAQVRDPNWRIQTSPSGIHAYNRDGLLEHQDPFDFWPSLGVGDDASHAFYLGVELARAQIAWQLGKRYHQDTPLHWGVASAAPSADTAAAAPTAATGHRHAARRHSR